MEGPSFGFPQALRRNVIGSLDLEKLIMYPAKPIKTTGFNTMCVDRNVWYRMAVSLQTPGEHALMKRGDSGGGVEKEAITTAWHSEAIVPIQYYMYGR